MKTFIYNIRLCVHVCSVTSVMSDSLQPYGLLCPWNSPCNLPGSTVHGILQARMLEWVIYIYVAHINTSKIICNYIYDHD